MEGSGICDRRGGRSLTEIALQPPFRARGFVGRCKTGSSGATVLRDVHNVCEDWAAVALNVLGARWCRWDTINEQYAVWKR